MGRPGHLTLLQKGIHSRYDHVHDNNTASPDRQELIHEHHQADR